MEIIHGVTFYVQGTESDRDSGVCVDWSLHLPRSRSEGATTSAADAALKGTPKIH